jgi:glutamate-1-semialdehyde 2,1-aminomutase
MAKINWNWAKTIIAGGNGLLSKRPPCKNWPTYFSCASDIRIWDQEGNSFYDASTMGLGVAILGYGHPRVDRAVKEAIDLGVSTTLNCTEEVELGNLLSIIETTSLPNNRVRFTRSGGEAMSMAIRFARAFKGKDKIAFCGYHGWHDWYLAANLSGDNLSNHLFDSVPIKGVPKGLKKTVVPFDKDSAHKLKGKLAAIVIEGTRFNYHSKEFIDSVKAAVERTDALLIIDEITSGFRLRNGGAYKLYGLNPDIIVYGKGMGNGYAIAAVIGKSKVMSSVEDTFISSTFWTERLGFVAALETLRVSAEIDAAGQINKIGSMLMYYLNTFSAIKVESDVPALIHFELEGITPEQFSEDMLEHSFLATPSIYPSAAHTEKFVHDYIKAVRSVLWKRGLL